MYYQRILTDTVNLILPGYTASKVFWFWQNHPGLYAKLAHPLATQLYQLYL